MPITIPDAIPARETLENENIFIMPKGRALKQDIRPLRIVILNLMPNKILTETQLLRLLSNTPLQVEVDLVQTSSYTPKNTSQEHLLAFYTTFDHIKHRKYDGMIITGAPVEHMAFEEVAYWRELCDIMDWMKTNVHSTMYICWGAQAGLYHGYQVQKTTLTNKMFGVFAHHPCERNHPLLRGFDEVFWVPHSRHTTVRREDLQKIPDLTILAESEDAGVYICASKDGRQIFVTGHSEYDRETLANEYFRDHGRGIPTALPKNYFPDNDPKRKPDMTWRSHANLLFSNWLNYYVYQVTPYCIEEIG